MPANATNIQQDWNVPKALQIIKGFGKTPTDNNSNEIAPVVVDLMSGLITIDEGGWTPEIPQIKNGGVWTDSPINDGRQLLVAPFNNVTETITVLISDTAQLATIRGLMSLNKMAQDCVDFWQSQSQFNPVYLMYYSPCGAGEQYALIYDIQLAPTYLNADKPTIQVDIAIEREPYWRGVPPGGNPRLWTLYKRGTPPNTTNVSLITQTDDLVYDTGVKNRFEWDTAYSAPLSRNYLDIPASLIPGDAPALVELMVQATASATDVTSSLFVSRSTTPVSIKDRNGNISLQTMILNAGDAAVPTNWTKTADATCGCISNGSGVTKYIGRNATLAQGTYLSFATWRFFNTFNFVSLNLIPGQFAIFLRCKQLNGAAGDIQARIRITDPNNGTFTGNYNNLPLVAAAGATCENRFDLLYLGVVTLPLSSNVISGSDGRGINTPQKNLTVSTAIINIDVIQNNALSRSIDFLDLIFMPIGEACVNLLPAINGGGSLCWYAYDNTGYLGHGTTQTQSKIVTWDTSITTTESAMEARGQDLTLIPGVNNRLYFIYQRAPAAGGTNFSAPDSTNDFANIRINIVPRWQALRDQ